MALFEIFDYDVNNLSIFQSPSQRCFFCKEIGTDFKISTDLVIIEFHGTFCSLYGWDRFRILKSKIQDLFNTYARITEVHIAQDFTHLPVTGFFKHPHLVYRFKTLKQEIENPATGKVETIYLWSSNSRWNLCIYDKTTELNKKITKSIPEKIEYYRERGYLDKDVTRVELKLKSDYCKKFIETFESDKTEEEICCSILNYWFMKHRIYALKKSDRFDMKHPDRHRVWTVWRRMFCFNGTVLEESRLPDDALFKNLHATNVDIIAEKIANSSLRYNVNPTELVSSIRQLGADIIEKAEAALDRKRRTDEYLQSLTKKAS